MNKPTIFLKTEFLNGLPYPNFTLCETEEEAVTLFNGMVEQANNEINEYNDVCDEVSDYTSTDCDDLCSLAYSRDFMNTKGNGYFFGVISVEDLLAAITDKVDTSETTDQYRYIGVKQEYNIEVPCYVCEFGRTIERDDDEVVVDYIIKRPYDIEDPEEDGNYIYDVYMSRTEDGETDTYVECLDEVGLEVLVDIFNEMYH